MNASSKTLPSEAVDLDALRTRALAGDDRALEALLRAIEPRIFRLAMRMLGHFGDAEDATQEVLVKVVTSLASFAGRSQFTTWVTSIGANHLRDVAERRARAPHQSLEELQQRLDGGLRLTEDWAPADEAADPRLQLEAREMALRCTQGMLMCLDVEHRLPLVLTEVFDLDSRTGAEVIGISDDAYRQRLSRGRRRMEEFLIGRCGLVDAGAACRCERQVAATYRHGAQIPIRFARRRNDDRELAHARDELSLIQRYARVLHAAPDWQADEKVHERLREMIAATRLLGGESAAPAGGNA